MLKVVTRDKSRRVAEFAFDYALKHRRQMVTCVLKTNVMPLGDGLFLDTCREVWEMYPTIGFEDVTIDQVICYFSLIRNLSTHMAMAISVS